MKTPTPTPNYVRDRFEEAVKVIDSVEYSSDGAIKRYPDKVQYDTAVKIVTMIGRSYFDAVKLATN